MSPFMQYFYEEQLHRMECLSQEPVLFEDVLCQMHDMVQPSAEGIFTMQDLKRQKGLAGILFNILFNLNKFIAFETRDPFVVRQVCCHDTALLCRQCWRPAHLPSKSSTVEGGALVGMKNWICLQEREDASLTDWDRFARAEYVRLAMEEEGEYRGSDNQNELWVNQSLEGPF